MLINLLLLLSLIKSSFYTESSYIKDEYNRIRIFHGINRIEKQGNYYYNDMLSMKESYQMSKLGFNVVRLGWMWNAFEPSENNFNMIYFNHIEKIVNNLGKKGIYTILDMHQDELGNKYCSKHGLPNWVINKSKPKHPFPWPLKGTCDSRPWGENLLSEALAQGFQDFYDNKNGMLDYFIKFWQLSLKLWKNNPYILGCEIINEPFIGNFYKDPLLFIPGIAGQKNLMPFYNKISDEIREYDYNRILFYEPVTWGMIYDNKIFGNGFNQVPGKIYTNTSIYSYHYYCSSFVFNSQNKPILRREICDKYLAPEIFKNTLKYISKVGGSSFMTEFGICLKNDMTDECKYVIDTANKYFQSWTDYTYAQTETLNFTKNWTSIYSRPYAQAISGTPLNISNINNLDFCFNIDISIKEPSIIFYKNFTNISVTKNLNYNITNNLIYLYNKDEGIGCIKLR